MSTAQQEKRFLALKPAPLHCSLRSQRVSLCLPVELAPLQSALSRSHVSLFPFGNRGFQTRFPGGLESQRALRNLIGGVAGAHLSLICSTLLGFQGKFWFTRRLQELSCEPLTCHAATWCLCQLTQLPGIWPGPSALPLVPSSPFLSGCLTICRLLESANVSESKAALSGEIFCKRTWATPCLRLY